MKVVVTGRFGQVAQSLAEKAAGRPDVELVMLGRPEFDLTEPDTVQAAIRDARPDIVVSAAAYTAVDQAEEEPELAFAVNAKGSQAVALAARRCGAPIIHISTDYVFSGTSKEPYSETDLSVPLNVYGRSKLEGEQLVARANPMHVILRTAWVYSPFGRNFVRDMLQSAQGRDSVSVVSDQWGSPTSALDLADAILRIAGRLHRRETEAYGTYHLAGADNISRSKFALAIFAISAAIGGPSAQVTDISAYDYPARALRPLNSRLNCQKFWATFRFDLPGWTMSLRPVIERINRLDIQPIRHAPGRDE